MRTSLTPWFCGLRRHTPFTLKGVWLERESKTDEHLIGTPCGMVRSRALNTEWKDDVGTPLS